MYGLGFNYCPQNMKKISHWSFRDTIPVLTVARVHFLSSKLWYKILLASVAMLFCQIIFGIYIPQFLGKNLSLSSDTFPPSTSDSYLLQLNGRSLGLGGNLITSQPPPYLPHVRWLDLLSMYGCHEWTALCYLLGRLRYSTCRSHCLWPRKVCVFKNTCRDWPSLTTFTPGMFKKDHVSAQDKMNFGVAQGLTECSIMFLAQS